MPQLSSIFRIRNFWLYLLSKATMEFATSMLAIAVGWHLYQISGSVLDLGLVGLFKFAPMLVFFLIAGWVADRVDRRFILGIANIVDLLAVSAIGFYLLSGQTALWPVFLCLSLHGTAKAFSFPAQQALLPNLVPEALFPNALATSTSVLKLGHLTGPALAGFLLAFLGYEIYFIFAGLYLVAAAAILTLRGDFHVMGKEPFGLGILMGGFAHVWKERIVLASISIDLVAVLFGSVIVLLPVFAADILQVGPEGLGLLRAAPGFGALLVAIYLARKSPDWHMGRAFLFMLILFSGSIFVFGFSTSFWLSMGALFVYGASDMISVYIRLSLVQLRTPNALRGRVSAVNSLTINASNELGDFRAGAMAAAIGTVPAVVIGAGMTLGFSLLWWVIFPQLRVLQSLTSQEKTGPQVQAKPNRSA